jgi:hypothetical protein
LKKVSNRKEKLMAEELDLVWGAEEIARVLNRTPRQVFHMLKQGELPARKIAGRWVATRKNLRELFDLDRTNGKAA